MTTALDKALALAAMGFHVFPLEEGTKIPAIDRFPTLATRDPEQIRAWWTCPLTGAPSARNIGISTSRFGENEALVVVDIDVKGDADGEATAAGLNLPTTFETRTPTGGRHLIYVVPEALPQGPAHVLGRGVDVRSRGGYIVAPGSITESGKYEWMRAPTTTNGSHTGMKRPTPAPQWLIDKLKSRETKPATGTVVAIDQPRVKQRGAEYLIEAAPLAIWGDGGNSITFKVAAKLKDFGISRSNALELMLDYWNDRCSPPWHPDELSEVIENAYAYGRNSPGNLDPAADFGIEGPRRAAGKLFYERWHQASEYTPKPYLVKTVLEQGTMSVVYGEPGSGKSFFCLDMAAHVARGEPWRGNRTVQGAVLYVAAEGAGSMRKRIIAYSRHYNLEDIPLALVPCPIDLFNTSSDTKALITLCGLVEKEYGQPVRLVVIDTLARAMGGGNENAAEDMGALIRHVDTVRLKTGAHTMVVHHSGKDTAKGARGHSSLKGATDTELEINGERVASVRKQRDIDAGGRWGFDLQPVEIGRDSDGEAITSAVVVARDADAFDFATAMQRASGKNQKRVLEAVKLAAESSGERLSEFSEVARDDLEAAFQEIWERESGEAKSEKYLRQALDRALKSLEIAEIVMVHGETGAVAPLWE